MNYCLIPAKGISKRVPKKNIKKFNGSPIIYYPIETAMRSNCFESIDVYTNSKEVIDTLSPYIHHKIINICYEKTNLLESRTLSDVAYEYLTGNNLTFGRLSILFPTSVFITAPQIKEMIRLSNNGVTTVAMKKISKKALNCFIEGKRVFSKYKNFISQELPTPYIDTGQFYVIDIKKFLEEKVILNDKINIYPLESSIDIDEPLDWKQAEELYCDS